MERKKLSKDRVVRREETSGGRYFKPVKTSLTCVSSGCSTLDCALGGGWALGRVANIIGDESTGKTLLAIETCANFARTFTNPKKHKIRYTETEAAFDARYAESVGLPLGRLSEGARVRHVKDWFEDLKEFTESVPADGCGVYVLDSLDAVRGSEDLDDEFGGGYAGARKAANIGEVFSKLVQDMEEKNVLLQIVSQTRVKLGVTFGEKWTVSGGKSLAFYSSQRLVLSQIKKLVVTREGIEREIGVMIRAKCKKNKIGPPFRECEMPILFSYGIDDFDAAVSCLKEFRMLDRLHLTKEGINGYLNQVEALTPQERESEREKVTTVLRACWDEVEQRFAPTHRKYA